MNRLASERSPYLLQHANNPVDWYPWNEEAFEKARREEKPIFLSIGYSTCHWCHVMEHESFESSEIAEILNRDFVSIKVDREERPDVDRVYMTFVQATTGAGGWPMSVWLTPDLKPFYGGTYFPPQARWGRPGFSEILQEIARLWAADRERIVDSANRLTGQLQDATKRDAGAGAPVRNMPPASALSDGVRQYEQTFDRRNGGFGSAPKFPRPSELLFLLREHARTIPQGGAPPPPGHQAALDMTLATLRAMAIGGMRDHLGGGFHRYSVDAEWRVPHFEKMLYDQAQLVLAYLEAWQASSPPSFAAGVPRGDLRRDAADASAEARDALYLTVAEDTLAYVRRDMTDREGGFYSAEDADSLPPEEADNPAAHKPGGGGAPPLKKEGAFYLWRDAEIGELLGADADVVRFRFGIEPHGNAPHDPQQEFTGKNLLYIARDIQHVAQLTGRSVDEVVQVLGRARQKMFDARASRPRPHRDDKILTAWNGLMIAAFARAARVAAGDESASARAGQYLETARRAASFIRTRLWDESSGRLLRRYRDGEAAIDAYAEDFAFLIWGVLELFQAGGDPEWLEWALRLQRGQNDLFWDPIEGGYFSTSGKDASVLLRLKEDYDGAEPSAGSVSILNLLTIGHLTGDGHAAAQVEQMFGRFGERLGAGARVVPLLMCGFAAYQAGMQQVVLAGPRDRDDTRAIAAALARRYLPFAVFVPLEPGAAQERLARVLPFVGSMRVRNGRATAYICRDFTCREPITDAADLEHVLVG